MSVLPNASLAEAVCVKEPITQSVIPVQCIVTLNEWRAGLWQSHMHHPIGKVR